MTIAVNTSRHVVAFVGSVGEESLLENQQHDQPDWPGTITNGVKHWTGVLVPDSQSLADAVGWEVFDQFVYNPYATWGYATPVDRLDKGADGVAILQLGFAAMLGPGEAGSIAPTAKELDHRTSVGAYDGFAAWVTDTVTFRYAKARITFTNANGKVVLTRLTQAYQELT